MSTLTPEGAVESRVLEVVSEVLNLAEPPRSLDISIADELAVDSLDQLSLFMALEDEFGGRIPQEDAQRLATLRDVVHYVQERMSAAHGG